MLIDWFTVTAQIVNFLILVGLLKHFLYDRIIHAMEGREERVRARLEEAGCQKEEAEKERESFSRQKRELEEERQEILVQARKEADGRRKELLEKARKEVENLRAGWSRAVQREKDLFLGDLRAQVSREVCALARRSLRDIAAAELEDRVAEVFLGQVRRMAEQDRDDITRSIRENDNRVTVASAFELSEEMQQKILRTLKEQFIDGVEAAYTIDAGLLLGIELRAPGRKAGWNVEDYLGTVEEKIRWVLDQETAKVEKPRKENPGDE